MTNRANYVFCVKEYDQDSPPWIMLESQDGNIPILQNGIIGFDLRPGTTFQQAQEIASYLNSHIECLTHTDLTNIR